MESTVKADNAWRLTPRWRQAVMVLHAICGIGWMGVDVALFVLLMNARTSENAAVVASGFNAIAMIVPATVPALSLGMLATGLLLGLGTRWGLVRYWWVLVKLVLALIMVVLVFTSLLPGIGELAVLSAAGVSADALRASLGPLPTMLLFPPVVSFSMLGAAAALSIFKPWNRTPWSRETQPERARREMRAGFVEER
jgi:hypothetical protein